MKALLIGINSYPTAPLRGCVNDVMAIQSLLPPDCQEMTLLDDHASHTAILNGLDWLIMGHGTKLLHFSGHGTWLDIDGDGEQDAFLCIDHEDGGLITLRDLHRFFDALSNQSRLVVLADCCHSGSLTRSTESRPRFIPLSPKMKDDVVLCRMYEAIQRTPVPNVAILAACRADQTAADARFPEGFYGAFSYHLYQILRDHRRIPLNDACAQIGRHLRGGGFTQTPQFIAEGEWRWE